MPTGNITCGTPGTTVPLCYGFVLATGMRMLDYTVGPGENQGTELGLWLCGEGEWAGPQAVWNNGLLYQAFNFLGENLYTIPGQGSSSAYSSPTAAEIAADPGVFTFHWHNGVDAPLGTTAPAYSNEPDVNQIDGIYALIPPGLVTPQCFSRLAYYTIAWTPAGTYPSSSVITPVVQWATTKCRIFDPDGNIVGYRFTTNPAWQFVDSWLRRAIKPEWAIPPDASASQMDLTSAEKACFDWQSIYDAATYFDQPLASGQPRFQHSGAYSSDTTLAAIHEEILLCCRSYLQEYAGKIYLNCDRPRPSTFLMTGKMLVPGTLQKDDTQIHANGNRYIAGYLETAMPAIWEIASISRTGGVISGSTVGAHAMIVNDLISIGGVDDPSFDGSFEVTVSSPEAGTFECSTTQTDTASSTGGSIGYIQSRFSQRSPELNHLRHQKATGQVLAPSAGGVRLKRTKVNYNFANCTFDQVNRLLKYEMYRDLGLDQDPYLPPIQITLNAWSESVDANGNALKAQFNGDIVTLDPTVSFEFAGDYEIIQRWIYPFQQQVEQQGGSFISTPDPNGGMIQLVMRTFNRSVFFDVSDVATASFATVPGTAAGASWINLPPSTLTVVSGTVTLTNSGGGGLSVTWNVVVENSSGTQTTYSGSTSSLPGGVVNSAGLPTYGLALVNLTDSALSAVLVGNGNVAFIAALFDFPAVGVTAEIGLGP